MAVMPEVGMAPHELDAFAPAFEHSELQRVRSAITSM